MDAKNMSHKRKSISGTRKNFTAEENFTVKEKFFKR